MALLKRFRRQEIRADPDETMFEDALLTALLGSGKATKQMALQVPTVSGGIDLIANVVAGTPVKLYREENGKAIEVPNDPRVRLLNDETGDTLNANEFWHAMIRDYYTGKGGYAYINRVRGEIRSLHYVDESRVAVNRNTDAIFKDFDLLVDGTVYRPFDFLKLLRNTKDGAVGVPITEENAKLIEVAYQSLCFELYLVKKGGNKKESSNTSVEMQLNENKQSNAEEFAKIFHISTAEMGGTAGDTASLAKLAAIPLMKVIECALNRDLLLEKEKGSLYWAFDTKELLKGSMKERFDAYKTALDANFMQVDEVRFAEDMEPLGLTWIKLGLQDVLYDPKTNTIYTPNTNQMQRMTEQTLQVPQEGGETL